MSNVKRQTIDVLILEMLCDHPNVTAKEVAQTWGEDRTRVTEWLEKFRKKGLCWSFRGGSTYADYYAGYPEKIREFFLQKSMKT